LVNKCGNLFAGSHPIFLWHEEQNIPHDCCRGKKSEELSMLMMIKRVVNDVERMKGIHAEIWGREQQQSWSEWFPAYYFHDDVKEENFPQTVVVKFLRFHFEFDVNRENIFQIPSYASVIDFRCELWKKRWIKRILSTRWKLF
jgi:hypothetical protein